MGKVSLPNPFRISVHGTDEKEIPDGIRVTKLSFGESQYQKNGEYVDVYWEDAVDNDQKTEKGEQ